MVLVLVEWVDPRSSGPNWEDREDINTLEPTPCITCGILLKETKKDVRIILSLNFENYSQAITINKTTIKRMRKLKIERRT